MAETATKTGQNNTMAMVAYILTWVTGLIVLLTAAKNDKFTRYHAIQAIGLGIVVTVVYILWNIVIGGMVLTSAGSATLVFMVSNVIWLLTILVIILCCVKAYQGVKFALPLIAPIAEKNA